VPLGLPAAVVPHRDGRASPLLRAIRGLLFVGGLALAPAVALELPSPVRLLLGVPYFLFAAAAALYGVVRLAGRSAFLLEEVAVDLSLLCLPIGAVWLLAWLADAPLLGFRGLWVLLTALHFHYAGFGALLLVGLLGRVLWQARRSFPRGWRLYRVVAVGPMLGLPLVAAGIAGARVPEVLGVSLYAVTLPLIAPLLYVGCIQGRGHLGWPLYGSVLAVLVSTAFAATWGLFRPPFVTLSLMLFVHGALNSLGFVGLGLLGLRRYDPPSRANPAGVVFSRLSSRGRTGPRFFESLAPVGGAKPSGLVDDFTEYARPDFDPLRVHPEVRRFYEQTADYSLWVVSDWKRGFRRGGRVWRWLARQMQQLVLPEDAGLQRHGVKGAIVAVDDAADGRERVRGWIRTFASGGTPIYVAAYASHVLHGVRYMNIAFPLPFSNLTSILRLDHDAAEGGLALTSCAIEDAPGGDQGVYLANRLLPCRTPFNETIRVWAAAETPATEPPCDDPSVVLRAKHELWLFGLKYLELHYFIARRSQA